MHTNRKLEQMGQHHKPSWLCCCAWCMLTSAVHSHHCCWPLLQGGVKSLKRSRTASLLLFCQWKEGCSSVEEWIRCWSWPSSTLQSGCHRSMQLHLCLPSPHSASRRLLLNGRMRTGGPAQWGRGRKGRESVHHELVCPYNYPYLHAHFLHILYIRKGIHIHANNHSGCQGNQVLVECLGDKGEGPGDP